MKKINYLLIGLLTLLFSFSTFADIESQHKIQLNVNFDWQKPNAPFGSEPIHFSKTITLDTNKPGYTLVTTNTMVDGEKPVTLALLVKPVATTSKESTFQFALFQYGFLNQKNGLSVIAEPKLILSNKQSGSIHFAPTGFTIGAKASW